MDNPVRILHLEDSPEDAELVEATLVDGGIPCRMTRVQTRYGYHQALAGNEYDLILADYSLPAYDGMAALQLAHELCPLVPFIFVSGTMGENAAIEGLLAGATDYVLKHRLSRLVPAVKRAIHEAENLRELKQAEEKRRQLEEQLLQAQKLESLGVLARGIAHDFNNILTGIRMLVEGMLADAGSSPATRERLAEIKKATLQGNDLTSQILTYAGEAVVDRKPVDLSQIVGDMKKMLEIAVSMKGSLQYDLASDLPKTEADAGQIRQVIMNFVINASEAFDENRGVISISTSTFRVDDDHPIVGVCGESLPPGRYVCLSVADTGCGMDRATLNKVFDPFYTTKSNGRGLGLATVRGIIRAHRGALLVTSERGKGSTFRVFLLAANDSAALPDAREATTVVRQEGPGTEANDAVHKKATPCGRAPTCPC